MKRYKYHIRSTGDFWIATCSMRPLGRQDWAEYYVYSADVESLPAYPSGFCKTCLRLWEKGRKE